jgi:ketosteroid isomerase-like protein
MDLIDTEGITMGDQNTQTRTVQELDDLGQAWAKAELNADVDFLDRLLADDFIGIGPLGFLLTKQQWLMRHRSGDLKFIQFTWDEVQTRLYGDTAIVIGRQSQVATHKGEDANAQLRMTQVYVRRDGAWRLAGVQMSPIQMPPHFNTQQR